MLRLKKFFLLENNLNLSILTQKEWEKRRSNYINFSPTQEEKMYAFKKIIDFLNSISDDYFISVGTLLGIYRDNEIIKWDDDIDIDFFDNAYEDIISLLVRYAQENKFPYRFGENVFHPKINIFINRVKVSIGKLTKGKIFNQMLFRPKTKIPFKYVYPTKVYTFKDIKVRIPANPEAYLIHLYGESWKKPIKWEGKDEYLSDYQRSGFQIRFLERVQIFVSQKIIKFINPVYFSERNFSK